MIALHHHHSANSICASSKKCINPYCAKIINGVNKMDNKGKRTTEGYGYDSMFPMTLRALMSNETGVSPLGRSVTQAELARHLGVTRQAVSAYALGTSVPDMLKFKEIADFFKVSYAFLLGTTPLVNEDHNNFAEKSHLGTRTLNAILNICRNPRDAFSFILLVETMEFSEIINAITAYLSIHWTKRVTNDELIEVDAMVRKKTGGALRAVPASMEKNLLIINAQKYLESAIRQIGKQTSPPPEKSNGVFWEDEQ